MVIEMPHMKRPYITNTIKLIIFCRLMKEYIGNKHVDHSLRLSTLGVSRFHSPFARELERGETPFGEGFSSKYFKLKVPMK